MPRVDYVTDVTSAPVSWNEQAGPASPGAVSANHKHSPFVNGTGGKLLTMLNDARRAPRNPLGAIAAALALGVCACTVGPDFVPPDPPTTGAYSAPDENTDIPDPGAGAPKQTVIVDQKIIGDWWTLFHSHDLDELIKTAIANNRDLAAARATLAQAHQTVIAAEGSFYPQVDLNGGASRQRVSLAAVGLNQPPTTFNLFSIGPVVSYALDPFGGTRRLVERERAHAEFQHYQLDAAFLTLTGNTVSQAIQIASIHSQIKVVEQIIAVDKQTLGLIRKTRAAGSGTDADVLSAETQLAADETVMPPLQQRLSVARHELSILAGRAPHDWAPPSFDLAALALPGELPQSVPSELARQRPDILAAEAQLHAASADIGIATAQLFPNITLSAALDQESLSPGHFFDPASTLWSLASALTAPIFHGGTLEAERKASMEAYQASLAGYEQTTLKALAQVANTLQALKHDAESLRAQSHTLDTAMASLRLQRTKYGAGEGEILVVLDAQRQSDQANLNVVRAQAQRYLDTVQFFLAMGGGWWDTAIADETGAGTVETAAGAKISESAAR